MKPPRVLKIGPLRYTVTPRKTLSIKAADAAYSEGFHHEDDAIDLLGVHHGESLHIEILDTQPPSLYRQTMLHEVLHAIIESVQLHDKLPDGEAEERVVQRLAPPLLAALQDNPRLVEFLTDRRQGGAGSATYWRNQ